MSTPPNPSAGGKTAPKLFYDLLRFFPESEPVDRNRLTHRWFSLPSNAHSASESAPQADTSSNTTAPSDPSPPTLAGPTPASRPSRHTFFLKQAQSVLPDSAIANVDHTSRFRAATLCNATRFHFDFEIDFLSHSGIGPVQPCGTPAGQLTHHFVHVCSDVFSASSSSTTSSAPSATQTSSRPTGEIPPNGLAGRWICSHTFQCSKDRCRARLRILIREPIISNLTLDHLTDLDKIKARYDNAVEVGVENATHFSPINILRNLLVYVNNSLKDDFEIKSFAYLNKVFYTMFGTDCVPFLQYLGFDRVMDPESGQYICWNTPTPGLDTDRWRWPDLRTALEDVREELACLISQRPMAEHQQHSSVLNNLPLQTYPAGRLLADVFGCANYSTRSTYLWDDANPTAAYLYPYDLLGALPDFEDDWVAYAFECQCKVDGASTSAYSEAVQSIAELRSSETLLTKAVLIMSQGDPTVGEVDASYAALGLPLNTVLEDDAILAAFYAASFGVTAFQDLELRNHLHRIGEHRSSQAIVNEALRVSSYEQAMLILDVQNDTSDDVVISTAVAKNLDCSETGQSRRLSSRFMDALKMIANSRDSTQIKSWLENLDASDDDLDPREMNVSQAYDSFSISDMNAYVDPETLELTKENFIADRPEDFEKISLAYEKIAAHNRTLFPDGPPPQKEEPFQFDVRNWPVGLDNIGNTCYLNSILQYLFTIKGLRELVLNYDRDQLKNKLEPPGTRRVGGRLLSEKEVARAQRFVLALRRLFEQMILSPVPVIRPERELAVLTLTRPDSDGFTETVREPSQPTELEQLRMHSKHAAHDDSGADLTVEPYSSATGNSDTSDTLVDDFQYQSTARIKRQKTEELIEPSGPSYEIQIEEPADPAITSEEVPAPADEPRTHSRTPSIEEIHTRSVRNSPSLPSLVRECAKDTDKTDGDQIDSFTMAEYAAQQQDVTEVMKTVLFQLEAAIPGSTDAFDENGEQDDLIKELFFMKVLWSRPDGTVKEEVWNDVIVYLPDGPRDIYSALDAEFDPHTVEVGKDAVVERYGSLKKPPLFFQVNVSRVDFDPIRNVAFKVEHHLELVEVLYLDRYLHSDDPKVLERRRQGWKLQAEIKELKEELRQLMSSHMALPSTQPGGGSGAAPGIAPPGRPAGSSQPSVPSLHSETGLPEEEANFPEGSAEKSDDAMKVDHEDGDFPQDAMTSIKEQPTQETTEAESESAEARIPEGGGERGESESVTMAVSESRVTPELDEPMMWDDFPIHQDSIGRVRENSVDSVVVNVESPGNSVAGNMPDQESFNPVAMDVDKPEVSEPWSGKTEQLRQRIAEKTAEHARLFEDMQTEPYHLFAQFMHQGVSSGGHYWINIRDMKAGIWRQYNDSSVTELTNWRDAVFKQADRWPATPYFLVYVRGNLPEGSAELTEAVCRAVVEDEKPAKGAEEGGGGGGGREAMAGAKSMPSMDGGTPVELSEWDHHNLAHQRLGEQFRHQATAHPVTPVSVSAALSDSGLDSDAMQLSPSLHSSVGTLETEVDTGKCSSGSVPGSGSGSGGALEDNSTLPVPPSDLNLHSDDPIAETPLVGSEAMTMLDLDDSAVLVSREDAMPGDGDSPVGDGGCGGGSGGVESASSGPGTLLSSPEPSSQASSTACGGYAHVQFPAIGIGSGAAGGRDKAGGSDFDGEMGVEDKEKEEGGVKGAEEGEGYVLMTKAGPGGARGDGGSGATGVSAGDDATVSAKRDLRADVAEPGAESKSGDSAATGGAGREADGRTGPVPVEKADDAASGGA